MSDADLARQFLRVFNLSTLQQAVGLWLMKSKKLYLARGYSSFNEYARAEVMEPHGLELEENLWLLYVGERFYAHFGNITGLAIDGAIPLALQRLLDLPPAHLREIGRAPHEATDALLRDGSVQALGETWTVADLGKLTAKQFASILNTA